MNNLTLDSIKQLLNHSVAKMDDSTIGRLRASRNLALKHHSELQHSPVLAWFSHHGLWSASPIASQKKLNWAIALVLVTSLISSASFMQKMVNERDSDIDIAILTDDLPVDVYVE